MRFLFVLFFISSLAYAQDTTRVNLVVVDTIIVESNSFVILSDTAFFAYRDTVVYVTDTIRSRLEQIIKRDDKTKDRAFYNKVKRRMNQGKISRELFDALFDLDDGKKEPAPSLIKPAGGRTPYEGYIIGNINLKKLAVFGPSMEDTARQANNRLSRFYNSIHSYTQDRVLRNQLLLKKGEVLTNIEIADNERIIRTLPFIRDARILVQPRSDDSDTVDLLLLTEDVIPYSATGRYRGWLRGEVSVNNNNILGTGHELINALVVEPELSQELGYRGVYHVPNAWGSFVEADLRYTDTYYEDIYQASLNRPFYVPNIDYAGGAEFSYQRLSTLSPLVNSYAILDTFTDVRNIPYIRYGFQQHDYWLARSFRFNEFDRRTRLSTGLRYYRQHFFERPEVSDTLNTPFHHRQQFLGSIAFSKRYYTTEQLVYTYGRTEDIPVGQLAEVVVGPEVGEYYTRWFTGLTYSRANYLTPLGYISIGARGGGFWRNQHLEEGVVQFNLQSYSYLFYTRRTRYRFFFNADYTRGIRRLPTIDFRNRYLNIRRDQGIRGLSSDDLEGNERLTFSVEGVSYLPVRLYSFQLALFGFLDTGFIAVEDEKIFDRSPYYGIGAGFRVRNENLAFKTFQVRMIFYPKVPEGESWFGISAGGIPLPRFRDFLMSKPQIFFFQ